jgi:hypothetical protein
MKLFTIEEANETLKIVRPMLSEIKKQHQVISSFKEMAKAAANSAQFGGGGMQSGSIYVNSLYEVGRLASELDELGVQLKDYSRGLIDFPSMRGERVILLCWQLGEGDEIEWWHDIEAGFAGRQPL